MKQEQHNAVDKTPSSPAVQPDITASLGNNLGNSLGNNRDSDKPQKVECYINPRQIYDEIVHSGENMCCCEDCIGELVCCM